MFWALAEGASKSNRGSVGDERTKPGVTEDSQSGCIGRHAWRQGAIKADMLLHVGLSCRVARAMNK